LTVSQRIDDLLPKMGAVDHDVTDSRTPQRLDMVENQRLAAHRQQRLGGVQREWTHPRALPCRQNHRFHRRRGTRQQKSTESLIFAV
jgi:hypothetical protein